MIVADNTAKVPMSARSDNEASGTGLGAAHCGSIDLAEYDFLDFGASSRGGCMEFACRRLGGTRGLGVDINPKAVIACREAGYECVQGDVTDLDLPALSVRFVTMSHVLEHLPDLPAVGKAIGNAARVASDFLFIQGPFFDADEELRRVGLKFYWSDWPSAHSVHLTIAQLVRTLEDLGLGDYVAMARVPVESSLDPAIHPLASPPSQHDYVAGTHPPKPHVKFDPPLFREMVCVVRLRRFPDWSRVVQARRSCQFVSGTLPFC